MTAARAEVGDLVQDAHGRRAIVTDIKQGRIWILRPASGGATTQWETDTPASLTVLQPRAARLSQE